MAEKIETVLSRSTFNTRARDYYDIFIFSTTQVYDATILKEAVAATAKHRGTVEQISDMQPLLKIIEDSAELRQASDKSITGCLFGVMVNVLCNVIRKN